MRFPAYSVGKWALVGTLTLLAVSLGSASSRPLPIGIVLVATNDTGSRGLLDTNLQGTTIYDGETLKTDEDYTLRVQLNGPQMVLQSNSRVEVHAIEHGFSADFKHGSFVISTGQGQTFKVAADGVTIRPVSDAATVAQFDLISANDVVLSSKKGSLELSLGNEVKTIEPGNSYRLEIEPDEPDSGPQGSAPKPAGANHFRLIFIGAVVVGTTIGIWRALESPSKP